MGNGIQERGKFWLDHGDSTITIAFIDDTRHIDHRAVLGDCKVENMGGKR